MEKMEHIHNDEHLRHKLTKRLKEIHDDVIVEEEHIRTVQRIVSEYYVPLDKDEKSHAGGLDSGRYAPVCVRPWVWHLW